MSPNNKKINEKNSYGTLCIIKNCLNIKKIALQSYFIMVLYKQEEVNSSCKS